MKPHLTIDPSQTEAGIEPYFHALTSIEAGCILPPVELSPLGVGLPGSQLFQTLFDNAPIGIIVGGQDYRFLRVNPTICDLLGYEATELIGRDFRQITHPDDFSVSVEMNRTLVEDKQPVVYEKRYLRKDGSVMWAQVRSTVVTDSEGKIVCAFSMIENISDRKEVEKALRETSEQLTLSNKELRRFASTASHDLREPLRTISLLLELVQRKHKEGLTTDGIECIGIAITIAKRLESMVHGLLSLSKGAPQTLPEPLCLKTALQNALENIKTMIAETSADVTFEELPSIMGSLGQMTALFQNLIQNSIKFRGPRPPKIGIKCEAKEGKWLLSIQDNGVGFSLEQQKQLFQVSTKLHPHICDDGLGFGLALCKKIVESHGGTIWAESWETQGSTFYFTLPRDAP